METFSDLFYSLYRVSSNKIYSYLHINKSNNTERVRNKPIIESIVDHIIAPFIPITHIIDNVYLGNAYNASSYNYLVNNNIKYIINAGMELDNYFIQKNEFV